MPETMHWPSFYQIQAQAQALRSRQQVCMEQIMIQIIPLRIQHRKAVKVIKTDIAKGKNIGEGAAKGALGCKLIC